MTHEQMVQRTRERLLGKFRRELRTPADDPFALPTAYGERERDYMNFQDDECEGSDSLGNSK